MPLGAIVELDQPQVGIFIRLLDAIISLEDQYIQQPTCDIVKKEIQSKKRFYPFLKNYIKQLMKHMFVLECLVNFVFIGKLYLVDEGLPHRNTLIDLIEVLDTI